MDKFNIRERMDDPDTRVILSDYDPEDDIDVTDQFERLLEAESLLAYVSERTKAFDISMSGKRHFQPMNPIRVQEIHDKIEEFLQDGR